jgi:hypothetical protein
MREITRMGTSVLYTVVATLVIVGVQWLVMTMVPDWRWRLGVLLVPALAAGVSVARLLADNGMVAVRRGGGRR